MRSVCRKVSRSARLSRCSRQCPNREAKHLHQRLVGQRSSGSVQSLKMPSGVIVVPFRPTTQPRDRCGLWQLRNAFNKLNLPCPTQNQGLASRLPIRPLLTTDLPINENSQDDRLTRFKLQLNLRVLVFVPHFRYSKLLAHRLKDDG